MEKIDFKKDLKHLYKPSTKQCAWVDVPSMNFLMVDGHGNPNTSPQFTAAIEALYPVAYTLKFTLKNEHGYDYVVPPLEGLWWADDMDDFLHGNKDNWDWTLMIMQPDMITTDMVQEAVAKVKAKKSPDAIDKLRFESYAEGKSAQIMHLGPYSEETENITKLHEFIAAAGLERRGKHHEIYLSDMRRTASEKLKTIIRQPAV